MKRDLLGRAGGMLLGAAAMLVVLPACAGSTTTRAAPAPTTVAQPASAAAPAPAPTPGASLPGAPAPAGDRLAQGKLIFDKTAGGVGCAYCHGPEAKGNGVSGLGAPDIRGKTEAQVRAALAGGVPLMSFIKLADEEFAAVFAYMQHLNEQ